MEPFYCNLLGKTIVSQRHINRTLTIVAVWKSVNLTGITVMGVGDNGEQFLIQLPDTDYSIRM
jgi:hypothetical protein